MATMATATATTTRWNIVETHEVTKNKTSDGVKCVNNYALLRTLGHGRFAKVKLCERIPTPILRPPTDMTTVRMTTLPPMQPPPPSMAPLFRPAFVSPAPPAVRRQFAIKIFSKKSLLKMKDYISQHDDPELSFEATSDADVETAPPPPPHASSRMRVVTALDRVRDEIKIMRSLYHRNIVLLFEVIESDSSDSIYLVLEYMPKGPCMVFRPDTKDFYSPLTQSVLTEELARAHILDILTGLQYLHDRGVCHRDLKPDNILVNATGRCHLSDFGCALLAPLESPLLVTDTVGTYQFLAPECCSGEPYDPFRADVWAVGVLLYIFLFGRLPFQAESTKELFDELVRCDVVIPTDTHTVSDACRDLLLRLMSKNARERISIAEALRHPWVAPPVLADEDDEPLTF